MWKEVKEIAAIMQAQKEFQKGKRKEKSDTWELIKAKSSPQIHARAWTEIADIIPFWLNFKFRSHLSLAKWIMFDRGLLGSKWSPPASSKHCQVLWLFKKSLCKTSVSPACKENWDFQGQDATPRCMLQLIIQLIHLKKTLKNNHCS